MKNKLLDLVTRLSGWSVENLEFIVESVDTTSGNENLYKVNVQTDTRNGEPMTKEEKESLLTEVINRLVLSRGDFKFVLKAFFDKGYGEFDLIVEYVEEKEEVCNEK